MNETHDIEAFEAERAHLFAVAYRMLGSAAEAEDILQDAWVRWSHRDAAADSPHAFLTTIVVRLCLDHLKSARARRETYVGPWLPEPLVQPLADPSAHPERSMEMAESLNMAFLVLLETLSPLERAAFLLREVFDHSYAEIGAILGTNEAACRKLFERARAHVDEGRPRFVATDTKKQEMLAAFVAACAAGDPSALSRLLANDVVLRSDGGGKVTAALKPLHGPDHVSRFLVGISKKQSYDARVELTRINGQPGVVVFDGAGIARTALTFAVREDRVTEIFIVSNPDKLARLYKQ